jgi:hypothetical protein
MGHSKDSKESLNVASRGAFLHFSTSEARAMLNRISGITPCTSIHNELLEKEKKSSSNQEEEFLIAKSQLFQSQDLAINPKPPIPQNPPREEGILPLEIPVEIKDDLFGADFWRTLNSHRPLSEYNSNPLKKRSVRKRPCFHIGHQEESNDGMSSDAIEGEPSPLEDTSILSPSMPTFSVLSEPISQPICGVIDPYTLMAPLVPHQTRWPNSLERVARIFGLLDEPCGASREYLTIKEA